MMINKRLIGTVKESKKYIAVNVILQWISLIANILLMMTISHLLQKIWEQSAAPGDFIRTAGIAGGIVVFRMLLQAAVSRMSYLSSRAVKRTLREKIYRKLLKLGAAWRQQVRSSEVVQVATEGVDQLETYFGAYLPQFFYAMLAPLTLFVTLAFVNFPSALVLLLCVPLIPVTIAAIQTWAKKLLGKYWGQYAALGDTFLENLQGLTTMKIYQADEFKHRQMNEESEKFRRITMKVLTMQLNSITIMDLVAYGGAAVGIILAATQFRAGHVELGQCLLIILLAADFFLPMRMLGSYFHIAMNGMAASDKIFRLLDLPEPPEKTARVPADQTIRCRGLSFSYDGQRRVLSDLDLDFPQGSFTAVVGESGCGKSTLAGALMGRNRDCPGSITVGDVPLSEISEESLMKAVTYVSHQSYLFKGTVRSNLQMGCPDAPEEAMWQVLEQVDLADFLRCEQGLDTQLLERGANFSGGQCQRLALARALLHDSPVYIFDEATSNIDVESENRMMEQILRLARSRTVILSSHRRANVTRADNIYVLEHGELMESGTHAELLRKQGLYSRLWQTQQELEQYTGEVADL